MSSLTRPTAKLSDLARAGMQRQSEAGTRGLAGCLTSPWTMELWFLFSKGYLLCLI